MNSSQKWTIGAVIVVVAVLVILALRSQPATAPSNGQMENQQEGGMMKLDAPVRMGILMPLTGDIASIGVPIQRSALIAQEEINAAGGIGGQPIEFVTEDSKCDPAAGAAGAQKLVNVDKVKIILGAVCSGETLAAAPIAEEAHLLLISPSATSPDLTAAGDYVFRTAPSDAGQGTVGAEYVFQSLNYKKAAVISEQTDYAQGLRKVFTNRFQELGGEIVADEVFGSKDTDLRAQILKVKGSGAEVAYLVPQTPVSAELLAKQMEAQELAIPRFGAELFVTRDMLAKNPALFAGVKATEPYFDETTGPAREFFTKYEEKYGEKPTFPVYMANMYSQVYLMKEGIEKVGMDTEKLKDWLYTVKGWKHALGELTFTADGDAVGQYSVKEVQTDGSLKELLIVRAQ